MSSSLCMCPIVAAVIVYMVVPVAGVSEVVGPACLMLLLGTVHCQIVSTESSRSLPASPSAHLAGSPSRRKRWGPASRLDLLKV